MTLPPFALVGRSQLHSASLRGEESSKFVGSFLPFNRKPTSLGFAVGRRGERERAPFRFRSFRKSRENCISVSSFFLG